MKNIKGCAIGLFLSFFLLSISVAGETEKKRTSYFNENWMKAVVSIEVIKKPGDIKPIGTGFLVESPNKHILLLTAKHVILDSDDKIVKNLAVRLNNKSGKSILLTDDDFNKLTGGKWFLSDTSDLACRFIYRQNSSDILFIPLSMLLPSEDLNIGAPLVILGFPMGLRSDEFAVPIARKAMASRVDPQIFIVDGFVFPGNSGGPVIYCPTVKFGKHITSGVLNEQRLVGLVSESISYVEVAISPQTKRSRIAFEDNAGLSKVIPADDILTLINQNDLKEFDKNLK